ncbi:rhomboid family intramembrane serine protease [Skermanella mucosa]|uniref:rhomboid family intramembrane serine protease n=1 Tax=Skermanella mucosa TaxID=1789672 RepID=UPI001E5CF5BD|nr:rhomboid family intramembrane serine protease [Skermanella mucosa]UEM22302.1 rhomboid family intramembrane serine protease [Skermanella mucosa]
MQGTRPARAGLFRVPVPRRGVPHTPWLVEDTMFTLPLSDDNPVRRTPVVTYVIIAACVGMFLWQVSLGPRAGQAIVYSLGLIPAVLFGSAQLPPELRLVPAPASVATSMFLHGGWMHLLGNMLYLWIFGNNVEDSMGRGRFLVFYLLCGTAAALVQGFAAPQSQIPMIGASGAIGGVLGAYLVLHPRANVRMLFIILFFIRIVSVPAAVVLGLWFILQFVSGATTPTTGDDGGVAFWAHVGGFVAGAALIPLFKRREVRLFEGPHTRPFEMAPPGTFRRRGSVPPSGNRSWPPGR